VHQQSLRRQQDPWSAVPTLRRTELREGDLQRVRGRPLRQTLDGRQLPTLRLEWQEQAAQLRLAVRQHRAGPALAQLAAVLGAGQLQVFAEHLEQRLVNRQVELQVLAVHTEPGELTLDRPVQLAPHRAQLYVPTAGSPECLHCQPPNQSAQAAVSTSAAAGTSARPMPLAPSRSIPIPVPITAAPAASPSGFQPGGVVRERSRRKLVRRIQVPASVSGQAARERSWSRVQPCARPSRARTPSQASATTPRAVSGKPNPGARQGCQSKRTATAMRNALAVISASSPRPLPPTTEATRQAARRTSARNPPRAPNRLPVTVQRPPIVASRPPASSRTAQPRRSPKKRSTTISLRPKASTSPPAARRRLPIHQTPMSTAAPANERQAPSQATWAEPPGAVRTCVKPSSPARSRTNPPAVETQRQTRGASIGYQYSGMETGKVMTMSDAVARFVPDGSAVAIGCCLEPLVPFAAGHELIRQGRTGLNLIGPISDSLFDQLIGAGCAARVTAAW